jgi:uncharacterized membrane protein
MNKLSIILEVFLVLLGIYIFINGSIFIGLFIILSNLACLYFNIEDELY